MSFTTLLPKLATSFEWHFEAFATNWEDSAGPAVAAVEVAVAAAEPYGHMLFWHLPIVHCGPGVRGQHGCPVAPHGPASLLLPLPPPLLLPLLPPLPPPLLPLDAGHGAALHSKHMVLWQHQM